MNLTKKVVVLVVCCLFPAVGWAQSIGLSLPDTSGVETDTLRYPVQVDSSLTGENVLSYQIGLEFNSSYFEIVGIETQGTLSEGLSISENISNPENVRVAGAGASALEGTGILFYIDVRLKQSVSSREIAFKGSSETFFNEGSPAISATNGTIEITELPTIDVWPNSSDPLTVGDSLQFSGRNGVAPYSWSLTNSTVGSIDDDGWFRAQQAGFTRIVGEDAEGISDTTDQIEVRSFELSSPDTTIFQQQELLLPIRISDINGLGILSGSFEFEYSAHTLNFVEVISEGTLLEGVELNAAETSDGVQVAFSSAEQLSGGGVLVYIKLMGNNRGPSNGKLSNIVFNEDLPGNGKEVRIVTEELPNLSVSTEQSEMMAGETQQLSVQNNSGPVSWSVTDPDLAEVSANGVLTALKGGSVTATATDTLGAEGQSNSVEIYDLLFSIPDTTGFEEQTMQLPVSLSNASTNREFLSFEMNISLNSNLVEFMGIESQNSLTSGWTYSINDSNPDLIQIAAAGQGEIIGNGDLLYLNLRIKDGASGFQSPDIRIENGSLVLDEGSPRAKAVDGTISVRTTPAEVMLAEPADDSLAAPVNLDFSWEEALGADSYQFQLNSVNSFSNPEIDSSGISSTTLSLADLSNDTEYYWRVRAQNAEGSGEWSEIRKFETVVATPAAPDLFSPADDSANAPTALTFEWQNLELASDYRFQLSSDESFSTIITDSSLTQSQLSLDELDYSATYFWRVQAINEGGSSNWSSVFSFTTAPEIPGQVVLNAPSDQATQQPTSLELSWDIAARADSYQFQLTSDSDFSDPAVDSTITENTLQVDNLESQTAYRWRVRAENESGFGEWSTIWTFETAIDQPGQVTLVSPLGPDLEAGDVVTFAWEEQSLAEEYQFELSTQSDFSNLVIDSVTTNTSLDLDVLQDGEEYWWRVRASNQSGDGPYSQVASFTYTFKDNLPGKIVLTDPEDEVIDQPTTLDLSWQSDDIATSYQVQLATANSFSNPIIDSTLSETAVTVQELDTGTNYFWRVRGTNDSGAGAWSEIRSFETAIAVPGSVTLISPVDTEFEAGSTISFEWESLSLADDYRFELSTESDFSSLVLDSATTATTLDLSDLDDDTQYWWRVRASNESGNGPFSDTAMFTILKRLPGKVILDSPGDGAAGLPPTVDLNWNSDDLADDYQVQVGESNSFSDPVVDATLTGTARTIQNLDFGRSYHWRVRARNETGSGEWSEVYSFEIADFTLALVSPEDEATLENPSPELQWHSVQHATDYEMQLATDSDFNNRVAESTQPDTTFATENLDNNTEFFWRVRALYDNKQGPWTTRSFTISFVVVPDDVTASADITFGDASSPQDYRLVALPGEINESLADLLDGNQGQGWQAYWDDGSEQDYLIKYDGSSTFTVAPGNGFWVTATGDFEYSETISTVELDADDNATIPLHEGWNIISNPLDIDVPWSEVSSANGGSLQPVWGFDGSFSEASDFISAKNGQAFYFLNDQGLDELNIPYSASAAKNKSNKQDQVLTIKTLVEEKETSSTKVVFNESQKKENADVVAPPNGFEGASLRFSGDTDKSGYDRATSYARIYRSIDTQGQKFEMTLSARPDQPVIIKTEGWNTHLSSHLVLLDKKTGKKYDLTSGQGVEIHPDNEQQDFLLVMGSSEYVDRQQQDFLPNKINVEPNYPNPFNPTTTLQFSLPEQADVQVQVYDVLGRRVGTLINEVREAGMHTVTFDASRQASGMYFAVFEIGQQRFVQKMMLIK